MANYNILKLEYKLIAGVLSYISIFLSRMEFSHRSNMGNDESSSSFSTGKSAQERGWSHVPESSVNPTSHDPNLHPETAKVPVVDLSGFRHGSAQRSLVIQDIKKACHRMGFFQVYIMLSNNLVHQLLLHIKLTKKRDRLMIKNLLLIFRVTLRDNIKFIII